MDVIKELEVSTPLMREYLSLVSAAAAGATQLHNFRKKLREEGMIEESKKKDFWDSWVTEADVASQGAIVKELRHSFPDDIIVAEEGDTVVQDEGRAHIFVDPCDGTKYFRNLRLEPKFSVSVGRWSNDNRMVGIIIRPEFADTYFGAVYDEERVAVHFRTDDSVFLRVSEIDQICEARILLCQPVNYMHMWTVLIEAGYTVEPAGPCTFACIRVAEGDAEAYIAPGGIGRGGARHPNMKWDFAAGAPLIVAASGKTTQISGEELPLGHSSLLASNGVEEIHSRLVEILREFTPDNNFGRD